MCHIKLTRELTITEIHFTGCLQFPSPGCVRCSELQIAFQESRRRRNNSLIKGLQAEMC